MIFHGSFANRRGEPFEISSDPLRSLVAIICRGRQELRGQFGTGPDAKLLEDVPDMSLHSVFRHEHRCADLLLVRPWVTSAATPWSVRVSPFAAGHMMILSSSLRALLAHRGAPR